MISMTKSQFDQFVEHARTCIPEEACGLIAGIKTDEEKLVKRVYLIENADHSNEHFTITPQEQLRVLKEVRKQGWTLLGNIHSHPETPSRPSEEDKRLAADPNASYLILSLMDAEHPVLKAFHIENMVSEQETLRLIDEEEE